MKCAACQRQLTAYAEGLLDTEQDLAVARHLSACPACTEAANAARALRGALQARAATYAGADLAATVLARIAAQRAVAASTPTRNINMKRRYGKLGLGLAAAAALAVVLFAPWGSRQQTQATAAEILRQAIAAAAELQSVHLEVRMRTIPGDNFEIIVLDAPFVPVRLWKEFGPPVRWRAENGLRTVVMDGEAGVGLMPMMAYKHPPADTLNTWVGRLMEVEEVLESELQQAEQFDWPLTLVEQTGPDGRPVLIVTVEAKARGDFTNDWLKNKLIVTSDNRRVYRFDAETKRLEHLEIWVHAPQGDVLVLQTERVTLNEVFPEELFQLDVPEGTAWYIPPDELPPDDALAAMLPDEFARGFFQALADADWELVKQYGSLSEVPEQMKDVLAGLEIVEIGTPFKSGLYPGWFVPYKLRIQGEVREHNLAVRNDNPARRWVVDGGF